MFPYLKAGFLALCLSLPAAGAAEARCGLTEAGRDRPRVLITTDIGGDDKDDAQSFIHALLYANEVDYRGFVATTSDDGFRPSLAFFDAIIDAYARDLDNLRAASGAYPSAPKLRSLVVQGAVDPAWPGTLSAGARRIVVEARDASPQDPLYVLAWGPIHDIARALRAAPDIVPNLRVFSIAGYYQDSAHPEAFQWMQSAVAEDARYAKLWWINSETTSRGMYIGPKGQNSPGRNTQWVHKNIDGHGALGNLYHDVFAKDLYGPNTPDGLKMGDTPSLLYLLDGFDDDTPEGASWGGSFEPSDLGPNTWTDRRDPRLRMGEYAGAQTVYRHRPDIWGDFARRLDIADKGARSAPCTGAADADGGR